MYRQFRSWRSWWLMALLMAACLSPLAFAQQKKKTAKPKVTPAHHELGSYPTPKQRSQKLKELLNLSEKQTSQAEQIYAEQNRQTRAVFDDKSLTDQQRPAKLEAIQKATQDRVRDLLNNEQKQKYDALMKPKK